MTEVSASEKSNTREHGHRFLTSLTEQPVQNDMPAAIASAIEYILFMVHYYMFLIGLLPASQAHAFQDPGLHDISDTDHKPDRAGNT